MSHKQVSTYHSFLNMTVTRTLEVGEQAAELLTGILNIFQTKIKRLQNERIIRFEIKEAFHERSCNC